MLFQFFSAIFDVPDLYSQSKILSCCFNFGGKVIDAEGFGELVEDAEFALAGWIFQRQSYATKRIPNVEVAPGFAALTVDRSG